MNSMIAVLNKKGKSAKATALAMLKTLKLGNVESYGIASSEQVEIEKSLAQLQNRRVDSSAVIGCAFSGTFVKDKAQPLTLGNASLVFDGRLYLPNMQESDAEVVTERLEQNREKGAKTLINEDRGEFASVLAESERLIAFRDCIGARPLFFGENEECVALASERKALWKIGIDRPKSFPQGNIGLVDKNGIKFTAVRKFAYHKPKKMTMRTGSKKLQKLLRDSVEQRVRGLDRVAIAFSGGLDSSIIAFLAKHSGEDVHLINVSLEGHDETEHAKRAAEELRLPLHTFSYSDKHMQEVLPKVLWLVEEADPVQASIGVPVYWTAERAAEMGFKVMLAGQGADEFFGGYRRYVDLYLSDGGEAVQKAMFKDVVEIGENNLERDWKICNYHNVELRLPFTDSRVADFALNVPLELKMQPIDSTLRKLVLRQVAEDLGLPAFIANRTKKAVQYATGVSNAMKRTAKKKGVSVSEYTRQVFQETFSEVVSA